ncbi:uncharacterized protein EI97DRAFT_466170 [Westerdykella ornata]|uniref:Uncharacterized protein n=1 Tax=Westerdykella ornata TaxID=318751 RepID=A0A6A6JSW9_WESOR|nr:uncharacterized protein EI97DRAFT_466170 [Westerdykella ornata]KAF2278079.1 hypothetical protein EI97DRAFT_466170 [Westerdykella ornata]
MGGRLSRPRAADGLGEAPRTAQIAGRAKGLNVGRNLIVPGSVVILAGLFYVYSRTAVLAAKLNAKKHREADGGQISWSNQSLRNHGQRASVADDMANLREALMGNKTGSGAASAGSRADRHRDEEQLRKLMGKGK